MKERKTERGIAGRSFLALAAVLLVFLGSPAPGGQAPGDRESLLAALLLKTSAMKDRRAMDIQANDRDLEASERTFEEAEKRMTNATETQNDQAIHAAREPLLKARAERKRLREKKDRLELSMKMAEAAYATVKDLLLSGKAGEAAPLACGLLSLRSGKGTLVKKNGTNAPLQAGRPVFFEPGDEIVTEGKGAAEILALGGRAVIQMDERSRFRLDEDGPQEQVVRLLQGKIYCRVDESGAFSGLLQDQVKKVEADPALKEAVARNGEKFAGLMDRTFTVRSPGACSSTKGANLSATVVKKEGTEISVFEGGVDVGDAECAKKVRLEQGFQVDVIQEGPSQPKKFGDIDRWWEK
jgi:hypothetical protein